MQTLTAPPPGYKRHWFPIASQRPLTCRQWADELAILHALDEHDRAHAVQASALTGKWTECLLAETADHTAHASSASEGTLLAGTNHQPCIPATFFTPGGDGNIGRGRALRLEASGILGTTGTPTIIFQVRASTTAGSSTLSGSSLGVSAAITTGSGVSNKQWSLVLDLSCRTAGIGSNNTTLSGSGWVWSPTGFASPFWYPLQPTTPDTATWTMANWDASLTYWVNLSATWSASSASNTITCKLLRWFGLN